MQNFYLKMYKNVYLRKVSAIAQRMLQKMVHHLILAGEITADDLPVLTDSELLGLLSISKEETARKLYGMLRERDLFREAVVIRPSGFTHAETKSGKPIAVFGIERADMEKLADSPLLNQRNQTSLENLENKIADIAGVPRNMALVVPILNIFRFQPKDITIYTGEQPDSLKRRYPAHFKNMEEVASSYAAFRVCAPSEYREKLSAPAVAKEIFDLVMQTAWAPR